MALCSPARNSSSSNAERKISRVNWRKLFCSISTVTAAPNCAVCHGKHNVLSPSSPLSPVNRLNVAKLCSGCHSDPARMGKGGEAARAVLDMVALKRALED